METKMAECPASEWLRECCVCYTRGQEKDCITCEGCGAMIYCSKNCQLDDRGSGDSGDMVNTHQNWCERMKGYVAREEELSYLPFTFAKDTTDRLFHEELAAELFKQKGVYGQGLWRRESPLLHKTQPVKKCGYYTHTAEDKWVLPLESSILESPPSTPPPPPTQPLLDWQQYYVFRGLPLHSPVAAVLTYAMTLYYILTSCLREDEPELLKKLAGGQDFVIHVLGVEKEVEMKEAFLVLMQVCQPTRHGQPHYLN
ncbi:zinc finger MYND domain-containing protein 15-like isoform X2 [Littorina saxatilis]|uniref:zinc finger MYND domain-containing protein 15-like isoform X2 n=1 Tax=Littorina saxatilis TaxID=31220 RepID=UPI0038B5DA6E